MHKFNHLKDTPKHVTQLSQSMRKKMTPSEFHLWQYLQKRRFHGIKFRRQFPVGRYIVDFYTHTFRLGIEIDGSVHEEQKRYDHQRTSFIETHNIRLIRFSNNEVLNSINSVLLSIFNACHKTEPPAGVTSLGELGAYFLVMNAETTRLSTSED